MRKLLVLLMTFSMVLAGCMDLTDEDVESIVDSIIDLPGCNDETAYNYDENATNDLACLTEAALVSSITEFVSMVNEGPEWGETMAMIEEGSTVMEGQSGDFVSINAVSPNGMHSHTEIDQGFIAYEITQTLTKSADGTAILQVDWMGEEFLMSSATPFDDVWSQSVFDEMFDDDDHEEDHSDDGMVCYDMSTHSVMMQVDNQEDCENAGYMWVPANSGPGGDGGHGDDDHGDDDHNGHDDDMEDMEDMMRGMMGDMQPGVDIPESFNPAAAAYELGLATENGFSFTTSMNDGMGSSMSMTFMLNSEFKVTKMIITVSVDGESSTSSIEVLYGDDALVYFNVDDTLNHEALAFSLYPMGGDDHDGHDHSDHYVFYCSNDGEEYANSMGGILCPEESTGEVPICPDGEPCVCIDVDGSCTDGDDDWGYVDHGDGDGDNSMFEGMLRDLDDDGDGLLSWTEYESYIVNSFGGWSDDAERSNVYEIFNASDMDDDGFMNADELETLFYNQSYQDYDDDNSDDDEAPTPEELLSLVDEDGNGSISLDEFFAFYEAIETFSQEIKDEISNIFDNNDVDYSTELDITELEAFIIDVDAYMESIEGDGSGDNDENYCTVSPTTIELGAETLLTLIYSEDVDFSYWNVYDEYGNQVTLLDPDGEDADELREDQDAVRPGTVMPLRMIYSFPAAGMYTIMDGDGVGPSCIVYVETSEDDGTGDGSDNSDAGEGTGEDNYVFYCSNDGEEYANSMGGILCPEGSGEIPTCPDGEPCVCIDVDGSCTDGDDDWGYVDHGDEGSDDHEMVCYDMNTHSVMMEYDNQVDCEDAGYMWTSTDDDDHDGHDHGDHDDHDDHGMAYDWMIVSGMDFNLAGSFDDYSIVLAACTMEESGDDMMGMGGSMTCGDDVMIVSLADATAPGADVMFHDADMSGTITSGDMVHINPEIDAGGEWNTVRLYSTSADSYSDENPMMVPGFGAVAGIVALLGAALLTRRD